MCETIETNRLVVFSGVATRLNTFQTQIARTYSCVRHTYISICTTYASWCSGSLALVCALSKSGRACVNNFHNRFVLRQRSKTRTCRNGGSERTNLKYVFAFVCVLCLRIQIFANTFGYANGPTQQLLYYTHGVRLIVHKTYRIDLVHQYYNKCSHARKTKARHKMRICV